MSEQQILSQISELEDDITRVEEEAAKKDASAEKEIEADWDDNINTTKSKLDVAEVDLKEATEKSSEWTKKKVISSYDLKSEIQKKYELIPLPEKKGSGPSEDYRVKGFSGSVGFITPVTGSFCEKCNRIRVTSDGKIRSCLFSDEEHDILPLLREGRDIEEIVDFIRNSISKKPQCHNIDSIQFRSCQSSMSKIGG